MVEQSLVIRQDDFFDLKVTINENEFVLKED